MVRGDFWKQSSPLREEVLKALLHLLEGLLGPKIDCPWTAGMEDIPLKSPW